ncbi:MULTISPECIES: TetR/AcrR family transcriptional regulator [unclassified Siphonobacter]|uniref:TetR/AcrR family transcriptional regulator n=1 Tax=unclassified Siphonobacter TaxID=2635712 RepID=UPI000CC75495|nr:MULTISPECIES: TetR/AcrR family transcriptional regulator [unclassified Siphonobacter]MDQ1088937.1 TetR/AcrR family transcriptional repressor of multidrug resistance operon [Siphonobacter sp. SORGH_AS_1065]PKK38360.1 TetR family transcriptional regulator [Siphonobacter sp. SORGH_AS_0500]
MRPKNIEKEEAIRTTAMRIIAEEGLENLSMQKLAKEANISPRTIYLKYENKEDLLVKLFIDEVIGSYEAAVLQDFNEAMGFAEGVQKIWLNVFHYFVANRSAFVLMQYGKSSPLLNQSFQEKNIKEGQFFAPVHRFLKRHTQEGMIVNLPFEVQRALLFAPVLELVNEYFEHLNRPQQIINEERIIQSCQSVIKGMRIPND